AQIRSEGDAAASRLVAQFDGVEIAPEDLLLTAFSEGGLPARPPRDGRAGSPPSVWSAIDLAIERIDRFHRAQLPIGYSLEGLTHRVRPLRRAGIYVPGGSAVYLSTLIMCAVPARIAGVAELVVATTPAAAAQPELLDTCARLGIKEIYRAGGAAGIAAMALGTQTLRRVDKIVGPGNAYVTAAKKQLIGTVGIDMVAGPTELVLIADDDANPTLVAADLLAQAEHGRDSAVVCITFSRGAASRISAEVAQQLADGDRGAQPCIDRNSVIFQVASSEDAVALANRIAPEHLSLHWNDAARWLDRLDDCGAIFIGAANPVAAGDYIAGPNHVLPTGGTARFTSPLGVYDFVKRSNVIALSESESRSIAAAGAALAHFEGLPRHARSLELREGGQP
ncbi:MAG TPA: histidinol dehydrogenase, partial [Thermoanaerobaculia bacterium]|nr:histidinol dehydrogenase [Thermoanaerobaculia bacterium]